MNIIGTYKIVDGKDLKTGDLVWIQEYNQDSGRMLNYYWKPITEEWIKKWAKHTGGCATISEMSPIFERIYGKLSRPTSKILAQDLSRATKKGLIQSKVSAKKRNVFIYTMNKTNSGYWIFNKQ